MKPLPPRMAGALAGSRRALIAFETRLLGLLSRLAPLENQRVFLLTIVLGIVCGLVAVAFHLAILAAERLLIEQAMTAPGTSWIFWTIATPTIGSLISGLLLYYVVPDARGSGIPQVKVAYAVRGGRMPMRVAVGKFGLGVLQLGTGASLGREGPTAQICAGVASGMAQATALSRRNVQRMLPVGVAAGIAAAFNAPVAAVTFAIEEIVGQLDRAVLTGVIIAAAVAAAVQHIILGDAPVLSVPRGYGLDSPLSLLLYALLGLVAALVAVLFTDSLLGLRRRFQRWQRMPPWARPAVGGLMTGLLAVAALLGLGQHGITGGGYATLSEALHGDLALRALLALGIMKLIATVFAYSSGNAGGIFAPSLFIGAMLGGAMGYVDTALLGHDSVGAFALVGMGAVFAGIIRAPITSVLIIFEMTGGYGLILPLMIANPIAYALAQRLRPTPVYEALLEQDGVYLPHGRASRRHALDRLRVADAMTRSPAVLAGTLQLREALAKAAETGYASYPVIDARKRFCGMVSVARLRRTLAEGRDAEPISILTDRHVPLYPDQALADAVVLMDQHATHQLAVVAEDGDSNLIAIITMGDIVRAQARCVRERDEDALPPDLSEVGDTLAGDSVFQHLRAFHGVPVEAPAGGDGPVLHYHEIVVAADSPVVGTPLSALTLPSGALIVAIARGDELVVPRGSTTLAVGDHVTLLADPAGMPGALAVFRGE